MRARLDALFPGDGPVLLDGAMGTALRAQGWRDEEPSLMANLHAPGLVAAAHAEARDAGARVLLANTFGLLLPGPAAPAERIGAAVAGVRIARKAAGSRAAVAGSVAGAGLASGGAEREDALRALVAAGVQVLVIETCNDPRDAAAALELLDRAAPRLPAVLCASTTDGSRKDRHRVEEIAALAGAAPGVELGLNCCRGPHDALRQALDLPVLPRWLKPSTGPPDDPVDGNVMAAFARAARLRGVRWIGGCCGTGRDELLLMAAALAGTAPAGGGAPRGGAPR